MKKLFFTLLFAFGFMLIGFANQNHQKQTIQQKELKTSNEQIKKYDFSLFKFITPADEKTDTLEIKKQDLKNEKSRNETTYDFQRPLPVIRFS